MVLEVIFVGAITGFTRKVEVVEREQATNNRSSEDTLVVEDVNVFADEPPREGSCDNCSRPGREGGCSSCRCCRCGGSGGGGEGASSMSFFHSQTEH